MGFVETSRCRIEIQRIEIQSIENAQLERGGWDLRASRSRVSKWAWDCRDIEMQRIEIQRIEMHN